MHAHKGGEADHGGPVRPNNLKIDERNQVRNGTDRKTLMKMSFIFESLQLTKWRSSTARTVPDYEYYLCVCVLESYAAE